MIRCQDSGVAAKTTLGGLRWIKGGRKGGREERREGKANNLLRNYL